MVFVRKFNNRSIGLQNEYLWLKDLSCYEKAERLVEGILGTDFFKNYCILAMNYIDNTLSIGVSV